MINATRRIFRFDTRLARISQFAASRSLEIRLLRYQNVCGTRNLLIYYHTAEGTLARILTRGKGSAGLGMEDPRLSYSYPAAPPGQLLQPDWSGKATVGLVLGLVGLIAWIIPIVGLPVTVAGIVYSAKGLSSVNRGRAAAGLTLSIIGAVLTIINASIGAYLGAHGQLWFQRS
jgi:hypothetical protein